MLTGIFIIIGIGFIFAKELLRETPQQEDIGREPICYQQMEETLQPYHGYDDTDDLDYPFPESEDL